MEIAGSVISWLNFAGAGDGDGDGFVQKALKSTTSTTDKSSSVQSYSDSNVVAPIAIT